MIRTAAVLAFVATGLFIVGLLQEHVWSHSEDEAVGAVVFYLGALAFAAIALVLGAIWLFLRWRNASRL